jgi:ribosomal protein L7/L12
MLIFTGYSAGLILTSFGIVSEFWWPRIYALERICALEKKIARLTAAARVALPEGQTEFTVTLTDYPVQKKITVIKVIREITGLSLKKAKDLIENAPATVKQGISKADVELIMNKLAETGAEVEVK